MKYWLLYFTSIGVKELGWHTKEQLDKIVKDELLEYVPSWHTKKKEFKSLALCDGEEMRYEAISEDEINSNRADAEQRNKEFEVWEKDLRLKLGL